MTWRHSAAAGSWVFLGGSVLGSIPRKFFHLSLALLLVAACSDSEEADDAGSFDASGSTLTTPDPPVFTPCPEGWREVELDGVVTCDPWPDTGRAECQVDEAHFPGESGCTRVGEACPTGDWSENLPSDQPVLYVRAGDPTGGSGTTESPFGQIAEAMASAEPGTVIALNRGQFDEPVLLADGVTLWGACVAETVLTGPPLEGLPDLNEPAGIVTAAGRDAQIRNLRLTGGRPGVGVPADTSLHLRDVVISDAALIAWHVMGGESSAEGLVVRGTQSVDDFGGIGLFAGDADLTIDRAVFEQNGGISMLIGPAVVAEVSDTAVLDTELRGQFSDQEGTGLMIDLTSSVEASRIVLEGNPRMSISVVRIDETSTSDRAEQTLSLTDVVVRGALGASTVSGGHTLLGARVSIERSLVDGVRGSAFVAAFEAELQLTDALVRDLEPTQDQEGDEVGGVGLYAFANSRVELNRVMFVRNHGMAIGAVGEGETQVTGTDVTIRETLAWEVPSTSGRGQNGATEESHGTGVVALREATVDLTRFLISDNRLIGVQLARDGGVDLRDGEVSRNVIGVNVQNDDYDISRLQRNVIYLDNERNLDSEELPLPDPSQVPF